MSFVNKHYLLVSFLCLLAVSLLNGCKDEVIVDPPPAQSNNYFPLVSGSVQYFQIDTLLGGSYQKTGTVKSSVLPMMVKDSVNYYPILDSTRQYGSTTVIKKYFRSTSAGIYLNFDTTGLGGLLPDTLRQFITIDREITAISYPLTAGRRWFAFKISAIGLSLLDVLAEAMGKDSVFVYTAGPLQKIEAQKVNYTLTYSIPGFVLPGGIYQTFRGTVWYAENKGIVRTSGNPQLIGIILGSSPVFADSSTIYEQVRIF